MPRNRTVKWRFWGDEKLAPLSPIDRLVFLGVISMADDAGRLLDNERQINAFVFPETDDTAGPSLVTLTELGRLRRGTTASGQRVIQVVHWSHQLIDRPNLAGALPAIDGDHPELPTTRRHASPSDSRNDSRNSSRKRSGNKSGNVSGNDSPNDSGTHPGAIPGAIPGVHPGPMRMRMRMNSDLSEPQRSPESPKDSGVIGEISGTAPTDALERAVAAPPVDDDATHVPPPSAAELAHIERRRAEIRADLATRKGAPS